MIHDSLEHESGLRPLGEYRDHCPSCARVVAMRERQAACAHETTIEHKVFSGETIARHCEDCGKSLLAE